MRQDDFVNFMRATICKFEQGNSYGTAHIYKELAKKRQNLDK